MPSMKEICGLALILRTSVTCLLTCAVLSFYSVAAQQTAAEGHVGWRNRSSLTGDWDGARDELKDKGIMLRAHFVTESAFGRLVDAHGGTLQITFTDRVGRSLSADAIGNQFAVQELYGGGQNFRLEELNFQQNLFTDKVTLGLGWSPVGDHFAALPVLCDFQNAVICGHLNAMTINSGADNFPTGQWGAYITVSPKQLFYFSTGVFQVNPNAGDSDKGLDLSFSSTGAFVPVELGLRPGHATGELPGIYAVGAYYNSSQTPDVLLDKNGNSAGLTGLPFAIRNGRSGVYAMADQWVLRDDTQGSEPHRGLRIGGMAGIGDKATATFRYFVAGGSALSFERCERSNTRSRTVRGWDSNGNP